MLAAIRIPRIDRRIPSRRHSRIRQYTRHKTTMIKRRIEYPPVRGIPALDLDLPQRLIPNLAASRSIAFKIIRRHLGHQIRCSRPSRAHRKTSPNIDILPIRDTKIQPNRARIPSTQLEPLAESCREPRPAATPLQSGIADDGHTRYVAKQNMLRAAPGIGKPYPCITRMHIRRKGYMDMKIVELDVILP